MMKTRILLSASTLFALSAVCLAFSAVSFAAESSVETNIVYGTYSGLALLMDIYKPAESERIRHRPDQRQRLVPRSGLRRESAQTVTGVSPGEGKAGDHRPYRFRDHSPGIAALPRPRDRPGCAARNTLHPRQRVTL
jgi:hypothetical protein